MSYSPSDGISAPEIEQATLYRYALPLARSLPVRGGVPATKRHGWIVALHGRNGSLGLGDIAPLVFDDLSLRDIEGACVAAIDQFVRGGRRVEGDALHAPVLFGMSAAVLGLEASVAGSPLHKHLSAKAEATVELNLLVDDGEPERIVSRGLVAGFKCFKLKVGRREVDADIDRVMRAHDAIMGRATLRLDANRAWTMAEACRFADGIADVALDYIEEPLDEPGRLEELYYRTGWPIAIDESVPELVSGSISDDSRQPQGVDRIVRMAGFLAAVVLKPSLLGDIRSTLALADHLHAAGLRLTVSSLLESAVGRRALLALAATPLLCSEYAGLATGDFFAADLDRAAWSGTPTVDVASELEREIQLSGNLLSVVREWK